MTRCIDMPELWHVDTINAGAEAYPRAGWNTYAAKWLKEEITRKPGSHFSTGYVFIDCSDTS